MTPSLAGDLPMSSVLTACAVIGILAGIVGVGLWLGRLIYTWFFEGVNDGDE